MSKSREGRVPTERLLSYLDDELSPDEAAAIERVSVDSESVRQRLVALRTLRRSLQAPVPALENREVQLDLRAAAARRGSASEVRRRTPQVWLALGAAATLVLGIGLGQVLPHPDELIGSGEVRAKSGSTEAPAGRWAGIQAFHLRAEGESPERLKRSLRENDGLLFAYTNLGSEPFEHLMIFCVDAEREVHWFYPAYVAADKNPTSIAIDVGREVALSEAIWLSLPRGPLSIYAAFTRAPLDVWAVEAWLKEHPAGGTGFAGSDAVVTQMAVTVE